MIKFGIFQFWSVFTSEGVSSRIEKFLCLKQRNSFLQRGISVSETNGVPFLNEEFLPYKQRSSFSQHGISPQWGIHFNIQKCFERPSPFIYSFESAGISVFYTGSLTKPNCCRCVGCFPTRWKIHYGLWWIHHSPYWIFHRVGKQPTHRQQLGFVREPV